MNGSITRNLSAIFADTMMHKTIREIIQVHSTNKVDVREFALVGLPLKSRKAILDLGCGFGFFTRSLKGKINPRAKILGIDRIPDYRPLFLETCVSVNLTGDFKGTGVSSILTLPSKTFDMVICSYALYFFPDIIPEIARILKPSGLFVCITHSNNHANECINLVKGSIVDLNIPPSSYLPYQELISRFDNKNGFDLLSPWFADVKEKEYTNSLVFNNNDFANLKLYFEFKKPYYLPHNHDQANKIIEKVNTKLEVDLQAGILFRITKDDTIFICSKPLLNNNAN